MFSIASLKEIWKDVRKIAEIGDITITDGTRKTVATLLLENGARIEEVATLLGNSPKILAKHYAALTSARNANIMGKRKVIPFPKSAGDKS